MCSEKLFLVREVGKSEERVKEGIIMEISEIRLMVLQNSLVNSTSFEFDCI